MLDLDLDKGKLPIQRTLGLHWDMTSDKFWFNVVLKDKPNTHRGILSLVSSVYDPLGFVAPITVPAKKLLQDLCKQKLRDGTTQSVILMVKDGRSGRVSWPVFLR